MDSTKTSKVLIPEDWRDANKDIREVVSQFVRSFEETSGQKDKIDILVFLCDELVCKLSLPDLEEVFLRHVFPLVVGIIESLYFKIDELVTSDVEHIKLNKVECILEILMVIETILDCVRKCIVYITEMFKSVTISQIYSLPVAVLIMVKLTFSHCQKSEKFYGSLFQELSHKLTLLFKKSFDIQKLLLEFINDKLEFLDDSEQHLHNIKEVCDQLLDLCDVTENIDKKMTPSIWKSIIRLTTKYKEKVKNFIELDKIVAQLCASLTARLEPEKCVKDNEDNEGSVQQTMKILKFLVKLLMTFLQSFQDYLLSISYQSIYKLLCTITSFSLLPEEKPTLLNKREDFKTFLISSVEPFLQILINNTFFANILTEVDRDISQNEGFSRCYLLSNIVLLLPKTPEKTQSYWVNPINNSEDKQRYDVLRVLLQSCELCFVEISLPIMLPGIMCEGKPQRMISFYEYIISRLSAFLTSIPLKYFTIVENVLLENILHGTLICSLMATDVWCFLARWSTAQLCYSHLDTFLQWLAVVSWKDNSSKFRLEQLVRRLLPLMATEHQELLLKQFPCDCFENLGIWSLVPFHKMIPSIKTQVSKPLLQQLLRLINQWLEENNFLHSDFEKCLCCLDNLMTHSSIFKCLSNQEKSTVFSLIQQIFDVFLTVTASEVSISHWSLLCSCLKSILTETQCLTKVLDNIMKAAQRFQNDLRNVNIARLMAELGAVPIQQDNAVVVADIFRTLISSNNWLVRNEGFSALRKFAEVTTYTPVLELCVPDHLQSSFQKFICAIPHDCEENDDVSKMSLLLLREQNTELSIIKKCDHSLTSNVEKEKRKQDINDESKSKRAKIGRKSVTFEEKQRFLDSVSEISEHIKVLEDISCHSMLSSDLVNKLEITGNSLNNLVRSNKF